MGLQAIDKGIRSLSTDDLAALARETKRGMLEARLGRVAEMELMVTTHCNLRCSYCWLKTAEREHMPPEVARQAVQYALRQSGTQNLQLTFFGGEPLLNLPAIEAAIEEVERQEADTRRRVSYALTTNGLLLTREIIEYGQAHGLSYLLSFDGRPETHNRNRRAASGGGTFAAAVGALRLLHQYQGWVGVRMTVGPDGADFARDVEYLLALGVNQFVIGSNNDASWSRTEMAAYECAWRSVVTLYRAALARGKPVRIGALEGGLQSLRQKGISWGCGAGGGHLCVDHRGRLLACSRFLGDPVSEEMFSIGSLDQGLTNFAAAEELCDRRTTIRAKCMRCRIRQYCPGGCPATNWRVTGSVYVPAPMECLNARLFYRMKRSAGQLGVGVPKDGPSIQQVQLAELVAEGECGTVSSS